MAETLRTVGRYELLEVIGRGGAAVVYIAKQPDLDRRVALKELAPHHAGDPSFAQRFVEESRILSQMNHPNIVTVHEFFEHDGLPYIAMEYLPYGSLRAYLQSMTPAQVIGVIEDVLAGLRHGQEHGIVHRDLKPENLLVGSDGHVKIADFGVARAVNNASARAFVTVTGTTIGTPAYMAPEQALGKELTTATDLYSLGIIVWEALAGRAPFESRETPMAVLYQQVNEDAPPITSVRDDVNPRFASWLDRMLAKDPDQRFPSPEEAWDEIEDIAIDLIGPRWRREAGLRGGPPRSSKAGQAATPVAPTITDGPEDDDEDDDFLDMSAAPQTAGAPSPGPETVMRASRRHREDPMEELEAPPKRRVAFVLAVTALLAVGLAIGAAVGLFTAPKHVRVRTTTPPAVALARTIPSTMAKLSKLRAAHLKTLDHEKIYTAQAREAKDIAADYARTVGTLEKLPRKLAGLKTTKALELALTAAEESWDNVAKAADEKSKAAYAFAVSDLQKAEATVVSATTAAENAKSS